MQSQHTAADEKRTEEKNDTVTETHVPDEDCVIMTDGGRDRGELLRWVHPNDAPEDALDGRQLVALKKGVEAAIEVGDGPNLLDAPGELSHHHWNHAGIGVSLYMHRSGVVVIESGDNCIVTDADTIDHMSTARAAFFANPGQAVVSSNEVTEEPREAAEATENNGEILTDGGEIAMEPAEFDESVAEHLEELDRPEVAEMARDHSTNSRALGPSDVAREEHLVLVDSSIDYVALACISWYDDVRAQELEEAV